MRCSLQPEAKPGVSLQWIQVTKHEPDKVSEGLESDKVAAESLSAEPTDPDNVDDKTNDSGSRSKARHAI